VALRPVSELGLVELTDVTAPGESARARSKPRPATAKKAGSAGGAQQSRPAPTNAARASRVAVLTAPYVVGAAAGVLLRRAALRR
jgi:hypothetical protein